MQTVERQIREAFIDGFLSAKDDSSKTATQAWRDENETNGHSPGEPLRPFGYPGWKGDLKIVLDGGANDQSHLETVIFRLRSALTISEMEPY